MAVHFFLSVLLNLAVKTQFIYELFLKKNSRVLNERRHSHARSQAPC